MALLMELALCHGERRIVQRTIFRSRGIPASTTSTVYLGEILHLLELAAEHPFVQIAGETGCPTGGP
jgi:hypothetical protein